MRGSLFGYGKTTQAIARILGAKFGGFDIYDDNFTQRKSDEFGNTLLNPCEFKADESEFEIPSPSFPREHELVKAAKNLISEYDFFYDAMPKSVWISGTNGKTTTTQMTQHLLKEHGSQMGGNVGVPLAELDANARIWVLETSSFTLHYTLSAKPEIYALLPITADHISWHGSFENYERDKLSVLERLTENDIAILPKIQAQHKLAKDCNGQIIAYEDEFDLADKMRINTDKISFQTPFLMDAVLALSIEKILLDKTSYDKLNTFIIEPNKLEELLDARGRLWVNDTKATNIDAALAALKRYQNKKIHLIIGGDDKGVSLRPLFETVKALKIELYAIGTSANTILALADEFGIKAHKCELLQNAVALIDKNFSTPNLSGNSNANLNANSSQNSKADLQKSKKNSANSKHDKANSILNSANLSANLTNLKSGTKHLNLTNLKDDLKNANSKEKANHLNLANLNHNEVALLSPACASLDQFSSYAKRGEVFKKCVFQLKK